MRKVLRGLVALGLVSIVFVPGRASSSDEPCTENTRACMIEAATTYLDALVSHDASNVRAAEDVRRTEEGNETANGKQELQQSLESPVMTTITGLRGLRWSVDTETHNATAIYVLDATTPVVPTVHGATALISERFKVDDGLITQIEAIFFVIPGPQEAGTGWE